MKKASRQLSSFQADRISKIYQTNIDFSDGRVPQGLCEACRTTFKRKDEGREVALPQLFDFKSVQLKTETRGQECTCLICRIARTKHNKKSPLEAEGNLLKLAIPATHIQLLLYKSHKNGLKYLEHCL